MSKICNMLLQAIRECENRDLLNIKKVYLVEEGTVRQKFYERYTGSDDAKRRSFRRAVAEALKDNLIKAEKGEVWLV